MGGFEPVLPMLRNMGGMPPTAVVSLTPLGMTKREQYAGTGLELEVLDYLNERGPSRLKDITANLKWSRGTTKAVINDLMKSQYIRKTSASEEV